MVVSREVSAIFITKHTNFRKRDGIMKNNNKGFSLVELIITIAIMAILVGVMAPQLIKYIEKSRVTADQHLLDAIYDAVVYAYVDPDVAADPNSLDIYDRLSDPNNPLILEELYTNSNFVASKFYEEVRSTLGWDDLSQATYLSFLKSTHDGTNAHIYLYYQGDFDNPVVMWITTTDFSGRKDTSYAPTIVSESTIEEINHCIHIE